MTCKTYLNDNQLAVIVESFLKLTDFEKVFANYILLLMTWWIQLKEIRSF